MVALSTGDLNSGLKRPLAVEIELSNGDVASALRHPLAAEIAKRPLLTTQKTHITCERCTIDSKHVLNTDTYTLSYS
jgi:hypothetical protein